MAGTFKTIKKLHQQTTLGAKEGVAFRYFSRPLASFLLYYIRNTKITPNQVTIASLIVGIAGSVVHMTIMSYWGLMLGGAFFMGAHVLDALDGQLARHRKAGSLVGMHFDFFIDELKAYLMYGALAVRLYIQYRAGNESILLTPIVSLTGGPEGILALGLVGMLGLSVGISSTQFLKMESWKEAFPAQSPQAGAPAAPTSTLQQMVALAEKVGHFIVDYPSYIIILCLLDRVDVYLILYAATVCVYSVKAIMGISVKLWRVDPYSKSQEGVAAEELEDEPRTIEMERPREPREDLTPSSDSDE